MFELDATELDVVPDQPGIYVSTFLIFAIFEIKELFFSFTACAPQPTEDSSSSPADGVHGPDGMNSILSDSDDRQEPKLSMKARQTCLFGNFESDSLNENFSPARYV